MQNIDLINQKKIWKQRICSFIWVTFTIRNASDYDDMFIASKEETAEQIANAEWVYKIISEYIEKADK